MNNGTERVIDTLDENAYKELNAWQNRQLELGVEPHAKKIQRRSFDKEYIKMYRWTVLNRVMELVSEPFDSEDTAKHFMECFNDSFILKAKVKKENGKYYVYSSWMPIIGYASYSFNMGQKGQYYVFANWS